MGWRTTLVTCTTCFMLGTTFCHWIADHNTLWANPITNDALLVSLVYYDILKNSPTFLVWVWLGVCALALGGTGWRLFEGMENGGAGWLFDGGSLVLLGAVTWTQISDVAPAIFSLPTPPAENVAEILESPVWPTVTRTLRDLAGSNAFVSVALTGVMLLQAGRYYSERPSRKVNVGTAASSQASTPPPQVVELPETPSKRLKRAGTPYKEKSEDEAMSFEVAEKAEKVAPANGTPMRKTRSRK